MSHARGVDVEVVRRLVEQQHVAAGEQDAGELDAPPLAAREHGERQVDAIALDAEARDERAHLRLCRVSTVGSERLLGAGEAGDVRVAVVLLHREAKLLDAHRRLIEPATGQHVGQRGHAVEQTGDPRILREVAERALAVDDAGRGGSGAAEHAEQARLAGAVAADEADLVAGAHRERSAFDDEASTDLHRELTGL